MSHARLSLDDLSPRHRAEVMAQIKRGEPVGIARSKSISIERVEIKPRIRQSSQKLNKTEAAFEIWLHEHRSGALVLTQSVTLKLANGVRYTPDFVTVEFGPDGPGRVLTAYEVKGFIREDAVVKLKVAAKAYPWIRFIMVTKERAGTWSMQEILST
jgi:hypothetical protein